MSTTDATVEQVGSSVQFPSVVLGAERVKSIHVSLDLDHAF